MSVRPDLGEILKDKNLEVERLYLQTVNQRKATPEDKDRMLELYRLRCFDVLNVSVEKIFRLDHVKVDIPG